MSDFDRGPNEDKNDSLFPALIETDGTLKILDHYELPINQSFRILETAPLSPEKVLVACLRWSDQQVSDAHAQAINDMDR